MSEQTISNERMTGAVAYLLGPATGVFLLLGEKHNSFVRFHAMQSTVALGFLILLYFVLLIIPIVGWLLLIVIVPVAFLLWLFLMWKAVHGERYELPYFGELAKRQLTKLK